MRECHTCKYFSVSPAKMPCRGCYGTDEHLNYSWDGNTVVIKDIDLSSISTPVLEIELSRRRVEEARNKWLSKFENGCYYRFKANDGAERDDYFAIVQFIGYSGDFASFKNIYDNKTYFCPTVSVSKDSLNEYVIEKINDGGRI